MNSQDTTTKRLFAGLIVGAIFGLGVGLIIGLVFAYQIAPVKWVNAGPQDLRVDFAAYYWEMAAEAYADDGDLDKAKTRLGEWEEDKQQAALERARIESSPQVVQYLDSLENRIRADAGLPAATPVAGETPAPTAGPAGESLLSSLLPRLGILLLVVLVLVVAALLILRMRRARGTTPARRAEGETPEWLATLHPESVPSMAALGHFVTSYALGNDTYDESFSIETSAGDFLGECGVSISETLGVGDPDKVTAFEVWLFDKNDIRTVTQVLMSEHAFNDPDLRASLAPKGEAVLAQVNQPLVLQTATLRLDVLVTEMTYGAGALPPNSFFDRLTIELVARAEEGGEASEVSIL